jgi:hypothetical protein
LAVTGNQVLNGGRWNVLAALAAVVLAALAEGLRRWLGTPDSDEGSGGAVRPALWPSLAGDDGLPRLLSEVTPRELGVHPSRFGRAGDSPYVSREVDGVLSAALTDADKPAVIVQGPRLAGTTSTLAEAAQSCLPDHLEAGFIDDLRVPLEDIIRAAGRWAADAQTRATGAVVWMDGLTPERFTELARVPFGELPPELLALATFDTGDLEGLRVPEQVSVMLDRHAVRVPLGAISEGERRALLAESAYTALRPALEGDEDLFLGRLMVACEPLRAALTRGGSEQGADRVALLHATTDWYRVRAPRPLSEDILGYPYRAYRRELIGAAPDSSSRSPPTAMPCGAPPQPLPVTGLGL